MISFKRQKQRECFKTYSMGPAVTLMPVSNKDISGKDDYRPSSLTNTDIKMLSNLRANLIQQRIKRVSHGPVELIPGVQGWFNTENQTNKLSEKKYMTRPKDVEKAFNKIQLPFMMRTPSKCLNFVLRFAVNRKQLFKTKLN